MNDGQIIGKELVRYLFMTLNQAPVPKNFNIGSLQRVSKHENGIHYILSLRSDGKWYYSYTKEATRPLSRVEQARLNMLAESYEQQIAQLRLQLNDLADTLLELKQQAK